MEYLQSAIDVTVSPSVITFAVHGDSRRAADGKCGACYRAHSELLLKVLRQEEHRAYHRGCVLTAYREIYCKTAVSRSYPETAVFIFYGMGVYSIFGYQRSCLGLSVFATEMLPIPLAITALRSGGKYMNGHFKSFAAIFSRMGNILAA